MIKTSSLVILSIALATLGVQAAAPALDTAGDPTYSDGWTVGDNGGIGFGAWSILSQNFIGSSTGNGPGGASLGIDTAGRSFGLFSNSGPGATGFAIAVRPFSTTLTIGETFMLDFDNGTVGNLGVVGFALRNAAGNTLFQYSFVGGGNSYSIDGAASQSTAHGFTAAGMSTSFTLTGANTFSFSIQFHDNLSTETFTGSLAMPGGAIDNFRFFAQNGNDTNGSQSDVFFNNIAVIPEPTSVALLAGPALLGAWLAARRRRS